MQVTLQAINELFCTRKNEKHNNRLILTDMKKIFTLVAVTLASMGMLVTAQTAEWGKVLTANYADREGTSMTESLAVTSDGVVWLGHVGSYSDKDGLKLGDTVIGKGTVYTGTSSSGNETFTMTKTDKSGNVKWSIYSTNGEVYSNNDWVKVGKDGSIYAAFLMRHTESRGTETPGFVDATGNETKLADWNCISSIDNIEHRYYKALLMKVSAAGAIQWIREVYADPSPIAGSSIKVNGLPIYVYDLAVTDDAIYMAGRFTALTKFTKADGTTIDLTPHNVVGWSGDSQQSVGDMYVTKFDLNGYAEKTLTTTGVVECETMQKLCVKDGKFYLFSSVKSHKSSICKDYKIGDKTYEVPSYVSALVAELDANLNVKWSRLFKGSENAKSNSTGILQYMHLNKIDDDLWVTGMGQYTLSNEDGTKKLEMKGTNNQAFIIRLNAEDGEWINAVSALKDYTTAITGYFELFGSETDKSKVWVYGYNFGADGVFLREYNKDLTTDKDTQVKLMSGAMPTAFASAVDGDKLYIVARGRGDIKLTGLDQSFSVSKFASMYACFKLPFKTYTAVDNVAAKAETKIYGTQGTLHVVAEEATTVNVYNLTGSLVAKLNVVAGDNTVALPAGIYIANGQKVVVR